MTYQEYNGTGIVNMFTYVNTVSNGMGIPILLNLAILPILIILFRFNSSIRKAFTATFFIVGVLATLLWSAGLLATFWPFLYFVAAAVSMAFPE